MILAKAAPAISRLFAFDLALCRSLGRMQRSSQATYWFRLVSRAGDGPCWFALALGLVVLGGVDSLPAVLRLSAVGVLAAVVSRAVKGWVHRLRPCDARLDIRAACQPLDVWSFPSGHTLHAVAFNGVLITDHPTLALALVPWTLAIATSRVVLGLHYPSDVAAGAVLGSLLAVAVLVLA
jgi:undecaprenyl-diphosphatase